MSTESERLCVSGALVLRCVELSELGLEPHHFDTPRYRQYWTAAKTMSQFVPTDLGMSVKEQSELSDAFRISPADVRGAAKSVRESWQRRVASNRFASAAKSIRNCPKDEIETVCQDVRRALVDIESGGALRAYTHAREARTVLAKHARPKPIPMPLGALQKHCGGWVVGKFHLIVGRSSDHKTTLARSAAWTAAVHGYNVVYWTAEDTNEDLAVRTLASCVDGLNTRELMQGKIGDASGVQLEAHLACEASERLFYHDALAPKLSGLLPHLRQLKSRYNASMIVFDYAQQVAPEAGTGADHWRALPGAFHDAAKDLNVALLVVGQIETSSARAIDDKPRQPRASDMYGGNAWRQSAFGILTLLKDQGKIVIAVDKWKNAGTTVLKPLPVDAGRDRIIDVRVGSDA